ncbi:MAG: tryptophan--tRNA ligase [Actinomycetota bacterium]
MAVVFSGIQPTGDIHLGNYLGAVRNWVLAQHEDDCTYCIVDLHAITVSHDPAELREGTRRAAASLYAAGLDPEVCTVFAQSHVHEHSELAWMLECTAGMGELRRMTQFKDKAARLGEGATDHVPVGLFTYPALMAADILLHDTDRVPVGDDQRQHVELTRDLAQRFNSRYGDTFVIPEHVIPKVGARVMDLQEPTNKMSKSSESDAGLIRIFEDEKTLVKKIKRAVTDSDNEVRYDSAEKPGVSNLLEILAAATGSTPEAEAERFDRYGDLKGAVADAVVELLTPVRERYEELVADPAELDRQLAIGADKARSVAAPTLARARTAMGFLPPV